MAVDGSLRQRPEALLISSEATSVNLLEEFCGEGRASIHLTGDLNHIIDKNTLISRIL
jgi:hypothetical protein